MIDVRSLTFGYETRTPIFETFDWKVERGDTWAVIGPSGSGKTSLLYLLAGLLDPSEGEVLIEDIPITRPRPRTGLILQEYGLLPWLTVEKNAALGLDVRNFYGPDGKHAPREHSQTETIRPWLERLGIASLARKYPTQISGGERQRTAICRTLALQPDILLMDEPFSSLDAIIREDLQSLTMELCREQGITLILVTHSIEEAAVIGKKILLLNRPPNSSPKIILNPGGGNVQFQFTSSYHEMYKTIRKELDEKTS
ncbi:MAG: ATP-binding cassette domain-containing protein [Anaerolineales bacterium]|nr:ATP-binding cassette domain-containing protein [Anaerolineales bacterium]